MKTDCAPTPIQPFYGESFTEPNREWDPGPSLRMAQVIVGVDWTTGNELLVYGQAVIDSIIRADHGREVHLLRIGFDADTPELIELLALVRSAKGRVELPGGRRI